MLTHATNSLVTCLLLTLSALSTAIRVDWNTNKGPIVPPTPRTTVRPQPPFREPAPVWEDQSNDIPNPNPYVYILPPPSRPRPATNNYLTFDRRPVTNYNNNKNYGSIISPNEVNSFFQGGNSNVVPALSPKYVPNVGFKYAAVVPSSSTQNTKYSSGGYYDQQFADKVQGKYNAKTKKYKAYEKSKYVPLNYYPLFELALPNEQKYVPQFDQEQLVRNQQLPLQQAPQAFLPVAESTALPAQKGQQPKASFKSAHFKDIPEKSKYNDKFAKNTDNSKNPHAGNTISADGKSS